MSNKAHDEDLKAAITGVTSSPQAEPKTPVKKKSPRELLEEKVKEAFEKANGKGVKVRATQKGTYPAGRRRPIDDIFYVKEEEDFSFEWMKLE